MIIHGGFDEKSKYTEEIFALNLVSFNWVKCPFAKKGIGKVVHHSACLVFLPSRKLSSYNIFVPTNKPRRKNNDPVIMYEGIYFFGGQNDQGFSTDSF